MKYFPYLRGKQFELSALKDGEVFANPKVLPIVEPVKRNLEPLKKCLGILRARDRKVAVVLNPQVGDYQGELLCDCLEVEDMVPAFILQGASFPLAFKNTIARYKNQQVIFIHKGFSEEVLLNDFILENNFEKPIHLFDDSCSLRYRRHVTFGEKALLEDGFNKQIKNVKYRDIGSEPFSEALWDCDELNYYGFGDYLTIGDDYSDGGGPAYAVAMHFTWLREEREPMFMVSHYVSDDYTGMGNLPGKFEQALGKFMKDISLHPTKYLQTTAVKELSVIYREQDFCGLGYLKKLSILHHVETIVSAMND